jgi:hypothetical protein
MVDDMRYKIVLVGTAVALSVAACGSSSNNASPTSSSTSSNANGSSTTTGAAPTTPGTASGPTSPSQPAGGTDRVAGLIASLSGNSIQVTARDGTATVAFTSSTSMSSLAPAQLTDVTAGSCVMVRPTRDSGPASSGAVTARSVAVSAATGGNCPQPQGRHGVGGTVASVNGNTIAVTTGANSPQTNVSVTDSTIYTKRTSATSQDIAPGKCLAARGTKDSSGVLQATAISLRPATNGTCGGPRHGS